MSGTVQPPRPPGEGGTSDREGCQVTYNLLDLLVKEASSTKVLNQIRWFVFFLLGVLKSYF